MGNPKTDNLKILKQNLLSPANFKKIDHGMRACYSYDYKQYGVLETWEFAWEKLKDLPVNQNIFHELIHGERKVKPYLDIEWYSEKYPDHMPDKVLLDIKELLIDIFKNEWNRDLSYKDIYVASCHRRKTEGYKISFRIVISTHPTIVFLNTNCASYLGRRIRKLCSGKFNEDVIDMSVYKKLQNIRLVGHCKGGEYVEMKKINDADDEREFIITNIDPGFIVLETPEQKDSRYREIKNTSSIDFSNETTMKYVMEKIKAVHPSSEVERIDANNFIQLNYSDRTEPCFCKENVTHDRIGFFCFIQNDLICVGCHSGNCVDGENKKIIKILGSLSSKNVTNYEAVSCSDKNFNLDHNFIQDCIYDGSYGVSNLFKEMYLKPKRVKWINDSKNGSTFYWDGKLWKEDEYSFIERLITSTVVGVLRGFIESYTSIERDGNISLASDDKIVKEAGSIIKKLNEGTNLANICKFLRSLINDSEFDKIKNIHPYLLSCNNGVIDLKTGILRNCVPEDNMTRSLEVSYDEHANSEDFDTFVRQITSDLDGEDVDLYNYVRWMLGYSLQGNPVKKTFFILYGSLGYNGKSMLLNIIKEVLGFYAVTMDKSVIINGPSKTAGSHSTEIIHLENSRFGMLTETSEDAVINDAQVKILTGITDKLSAREIYGKQREFSPTFVPIISSNHKMKINLKDKAMYERCILIPFRLSFMENPDPTKPYEKQGDPLLAEKFKNNKEGILKWLVECSLFYHSNTNLPIPQTILKAKQEYRKDMDDYADFIDRNIIETKSPQDSIALKDIMIIYKEFAKDNNITFDRRKAEKMITDCLGGSEGNRTPKFIGYKFKEEE
jgi:P4 family phage/plasmid primase-like protien